MSAPRRTISLLHIPSWDAGWESSSPGIRGLSDFVVDRLRRLEGVTGTLTGFRRQRARCPALQWRPGPVLKQDWELP